MSYILDSDVLIWILRGHQPTVEFVNRLPDVESVGCSSVSLYEVYVGLKDREERSTEFYLRGFTHYPLTPEIARIGGAYFREWRKRGVTLQAMDALIAATAQHHELTLVTYNARHFPMTDIKIHGLSL